MKKGFIWHKVSEKEKQEIKEQAKHLLEEFSSKLEKIKTKEMHFESKDGTRQEGSGWKTSEEFRSTILSNAPSVEEEFIVAEKGEWKK